MHDVPIKWIKFQHSFNTFTLFKFTFCCFDNTLVWHCHMCNSVQFALDYYNVRFRNLSFPTRFRPYYRIILHAALFNIKYSHIIARVQNRLAQKFNTTFMYRHRLKCWHSALEVFFVVVTQVTFNQLHRV